MSSITDVVEVPGTFRRGVHPHGSKGYSADAKIEVLPTPERVALPLLQHTGAAAESVVKPRQEVALGDLVGKATGFVSAAVHASLAGTVEMPSVTTLPNGRHVRTIPLKAGPNPLAGRALWDALLGGDWPKDDGGIEPKRIVEAVQAAGIVGLGGAAFPTHVKLALNPAKPIDTLLVNGCECEPYLTSDYRLMLEAPAPILAGAMLAARALGAKQVLVAIEDNKPLAIEQIRRAAAGTSIRVAALSTKYPMGGERQLIPAALGRKVPTGGLPLDVGVVVVNVGTAAAIAAAVLRNRPCTHRVICVTGPGVRKPKNLLVPIGVRYADLIEHCGGLTEDAARVISGGPMMGFALGSLEVPVTKGASGVTVLTRAQVRREEETACVRCGRCVDVCPLRLVPTKLALAARAGDWETARRYFLAACCECGCCGYVCPARIPLVQLIRQGKAQMPRE